MNMIHTMDGYGGDLELELQNRPDFGFLEVRNVDFFKIIIPE